jgi:hypothetical protein
MAFGLLVPRSLVGFRSSIYLIYRYYVYPIHTRTPRPYPRQPANAIAHARLSTIHYNAYP